MRIRTTRPLSIGTCALAALFLGCTTFAGPEPTAADPQPRVLEERWYALYLNDQKAGYQHFRTTEIPAGDATHYESFVRQEFSFTRGNFSMRIVSNTRILEDEDGRLVEFSHKLSGPINSQTDGRVEGEELLLTTATALGARIARVPTHEGLCPQALERMRDEMGSEPGTTYTAKAFIPDTPAKAVDVTATVVGKEVVQVFEVKKLLNRLDATASILPGIVTSEWFDDAGTVWLSRAEFLGTMKLETRLAAKEVALAPDDPAELLGSSIVSVEGAIKGARSLDRLVVLLEPLGDGVELSLDPGPHQEVEVTETGLRVTVRRADPSETYDLPYSGTEYAGLTGPNLWLESDHPAVIAMSKEAVGDAKDALTAARRIEAYVADVIDEKNLSVGFATAAETALQKEGDCSEHAVLAAALARSAGMPSRVVGGVAYVDEFPVLGGRGFGYHMWAEVYVSEWLPIDPALGAHDATHIDMLRSGLDEPGALLDASSAIAGFLGRVKVKVLETEP